MIMLENFLQAATAGIVVGCIYGLMCVGLAIIFGVMRVVNFAQGEIMMLGGYAVIYLFTGWGVFAVGYLLHRYLLSRVTGAKGAGIEGEGHYAQLILTLGISLVLQNAGLIVFGSTPVTNQTPLSRTAWEIGPLTGDFVSIFLNRGASSPPPYPPSSPSRSCRGILAPLNDRLRVPPVRAAVDRYSRVAWNSARRYGVVRSLP